MRGPDNSPNKQIRKGISWNALNLIFNKGLSLLLRIFIAKFLVPEDFGLFAMALVFLELTFILVDLGMKTALIQRSRDSQTSLRHDSAFWFLLGVATLWATIFAFVLSNLMVWIYTEPGVKNVAQALSICIVLHGLSILPEVRLVKRLRYKQIVLSELSGTVMGTAAAVTLAMGGAGVGALILQQIVTLSVRTVLLWRFAKWRPRFRFSLSSLYDLVGFSGWMLGTQILYYVRTNMDKIAVGTFLGASSLGVYTIAYLITENLRAQIVRVISRVMLPVYSRMQSRPAEIGPHYLLVTRLMTLLLFPFLLTIEIYAAPLVDYLFGETWQAAAYPAKILAIGGLIYAIGGPASEVLQGIGKSNVLFKISLINITCFGIPLTLFLTAFYGLSGTAWAMVIAFLAMRALTFFALRKYVRVGFTELLNSIMPALIAGGIAVTIATTLLDSDPALGIMTIAIVYAATTALVTKNSKKVT